MSTPGHRLRQAREQRGFATARDAARAYGWEMSTYASHENGSRGIPPDAAITYTHAYQVSLDWLYRGNTTLNSMGIGVRPSLAFKIVPRLSWNFLGQFGSVETAMEKATEFASLPKTLAFEMPAFSLTVADNSMRNAGQPISFEEGDEIILSCRAEIQPGSYVVAELFVENAVTFRQYRERGRNTDGFMTYELAPLNTAYPTLTISAPEQARIVAKMTHSIKSYA